MSRIREIMSMMLSMGPHLIFIHIAHHSRPQRPRTQRHDRDWPHHARRVTPVGHSTHAMAWPCYGRTCSITVSGEQLKGETSRYGQQHPAAWQQCEICERLAYLQRFVSLPPSEWSRSRPGVPVHLLRDCTACNSALDACASSRASRESRTKV